VNESLLSRALRETIASLKFSDSRNTPRITPRFPCFHGLHALNLLVFGSDGWHLSVGNVGSQLGDGNAVVPRFVQLRSACYVGLHALFLVFHFLTVAICTTPPLFVDGCEAGRWWRGRRRWTGRAVHLLCRKGGLRNIKAHGYINLFVISIIYSYYKGSIVVGSVTPAYSHTTQQTKVGLYNSGFRERPDRGRGRERPLNLRIEVVQCCVSGASHWSRGATSRRDLTIPPVGLTTGLGV